MYGCNFAVKQLSEKAIEHRKKIMVAIIDQEKEFDRVREQFIGNIRIIWELVNRIIWNKRTDT